MKEGPGPASRLGGSLWEGGVAGAGLCELSWRGVGSGRPVGVCFSLGQSFCFLFLNSLSGCPVPSWP